MPMEASGGFFSWLLSVVMLYLYDYSPLGAEFVYTGADMPIFEYKCSKCGNLSEFLENSNSPLARKCVHCGSEKLEKQFSTFSARVADGASKKCHGCSDHQCPHAGGF